MGIVTEDTIKKFDPQDMWGLITAFPAQIEDALSRTLSFAYFAPNEPPASVALCGMGGSALAADVARGILEDELPVPLVTVRGYALPKFVGKNTLAVISSFSGNTEETLETYESARKRDARIVCMTSGGELEKRAARDGIPVLAIPGGRPPRTALGYMIVYLFDILERAHLVPNMHEAIEETILLLRKRLPQYMEYTSPVKNPPLQLAAHLQGKIPIIYGCASYLESVAFRWKAQFNENSKAIAYHNTLPELSHNEYQGWDTTEFLTKSLYLIFLHDPGEDNRLKRQAHIIRRAIEARAGGYDEFWGEGRSRFARLLSLILAGDFASFYLAIMNETDPTAIPSITELKRRMKEDS